MTDYDYSLFLGFGQCHELNLRTSRRKKGNPIGFVHFPEPKPEPRPAKAPKPKKRRLRRAPT